MNQNQQNDQVLNTAEANKATEAKESTPSSPKGETVRRAPARRLAVKRTVTPPTNRPTNGGQRPDMNAQIKKTEPQVKEEPEIKTESLSANEVNVSEKTVPQAAADKKAERKIKKDEKQFKKKKQSRKKTGVSGIKIALWILMVLALISGIAVITFFATGNRQVKEIFRKGDMEYSIIYVGQYDEGGNITDGKLSFSDNTSADITANGDGTYTVNYSNGTVYVGKFESMHRNGKGTLTFKNGDVYEGDFYYDEMSGVGKYTYKNGDVYEGEFLQNKKNGTGKYTFNNGDVYEGKFENDLRNGFGTYTYADGSVYEGNYVDNKRNDENASMTIRYQDGTQDVYIGSFINDSREGYGKYTWASGDCYEGSFKGNNINGHGRYTWASGRTYEGEFLNGNIVKNADVYPE